MMKTVPLHKLYTYFMPLIDNSSNLYRELSFILLNCAATSILHPI